MAMIYFLGSYERTIVEQHQITNSFFLVFKYQILIEAQLCAGGFAVPAGDKPAAP
jgi:hypothetical protein